MDAPIKLLAYNVWAAEYDKTGSLSVGVNIFDRLYLKALPIPCPWYQLLIWNKNISNKDNWENLTNRNIWFFLMNDQNIVLVVPPYKNKKIEKCKSINFDDYLK